MIFLKAAAGADSGTMFKVLIFLAGACFFAVRRFVKKN
jgi:hypothetical protein